MATMRESLMKLAEVAKPVPGDEQEFVAKHVIKTFDPQGKDSISQESPYELILKNVAAIKSPGQPGKDDHGHDAPGESEKAYHLPESRDAKLAKLAEMMGKDKEDEQDEEDEEDEEDGEEDEDEDEDEKEVKEAKKEVVGVKMHYHNPKTNEKFHEVHFSVPAAEKFRKQHEKSGYKLVKKEAQFNEEVEQVDELNKSTLGSYVRQAMRDVSSASRLQRGYEVSGHDDAAKAMRKFANKRRTGIIKATWKLQKEDVQEELLPKQKAIAKDLLAKEMQKRKEERNAKRQAGTPKLAEEDRREENDVVRMARVATPRPQTPETVEGMRHRLQTVKKQIIDKT